MNRQTIIFCVLCTITVTNSWGAAAGPSTDEADPLKQKVALLQQENDFRENIYNALKKDDFDAAFARLKEYNYYYFSFYGTYPHQEPNSIQQLLGFDQHLYVRFPYFHKYLMDIPFTEEEVSPLMYTIAGEIKYESCSATMLVENCKTLIINAPVFLNSIPPKLGLCVNLETLALNYFVLHKTGPLSGDINQLPTLNETLEKLKNLKTFKLETRKIDDLPRSLAHCTQLKSLILSNTPLNKPAIFKSLRYIVKRLPNLQLLDISNCGLWPDQIDKVQDYCPNLVIRNDVSSDDEID